MIYPDSITVVRAPLVAGAHGKARDWANATREAYDDVQVQPSAASEPEAVGGDANREAAVSGWLVYTKPGTVVDVAPTDRVEWSGVDTALQVDGEVGTWNSPVTGAYHHQQFRLKRVTG